MSEVSQEKPEAPAPPQAAIHVAPSPHLSRRGVSTRRMMIDVLIALVPVMAVAGWVFGWYALKQVGICVATCVAAEMVFTVMRRRCPMVIVDGSAAVTGMILGLSLPWSAPWYVAVIASVVAIGIGKVVFGGLGQNLFNPAMVGRAFVMICFAQALGAGAYIAESGAGGDAISQATPMTVLQAGGKVELRPLLRGDVNGSLGETSFLACLIGGLYLCIRRTAAWEIPAGILLAVILIESIANLTDPQTNYTLMHHLLGGALMFGAFFIATDPVSSPLTPCGRWVFGLGVGALVVLLRTCSNYPEGVMFAVLVMNSLVPLINRWTIPKPVGGPVPVKE